MMRLADLIRPRHKRASRALGLALTARDTPSWEAAEVIWRASLNPYERASHAFMALAACDPEQAAQIGMNWPHSPLDAGPPLSPFADLMGEALQWAEIASVAERKCYCLAAYLALDPADRSAFLAKISDEMAA